MSASSSSPLPTSARSSSFFFSSRRRHTRWPRDWSSDVCSSDLIHQESRLANCTGGLCSLRVGILDVLRLVQNHRKPGQVGKLWRKQAQLRVIDEIGRASCREREECGECEMRTEGR